MIPFLPEDCKFIDGNMYINVEKRVLEGDRASLAWWQDERKEEVPLTVADLN